MVTVARRRRDVEKMHTDEQDADVRPLVAPLRLNDAPHPPTRKQQRTVVLAKIRVQRLNDVAEKPSPGVKQRVVILGMPDARALTDPPMPPTAEPPPDPPERRRGPSVSSPHRPKKLATVVQKSMVKPPAKLHSTKPSVQMAPPPRSMKQLEKNVGQVCPARPVRAVPIKLDPV